MEQTRKIQSENALSQLSGQLTSFRDQYSLSDAAFREQDGIVRDTSLQIPQKNFQIANERAREEWNEMQVTMYEIKARALSVLSPSFAEDALAMVTKNRAEAAAARARRIALEQEKVVLETRQQAAILERQKQDTVRKNAKNGIQVTEEGIGFQGKVRAGAVQSIQDLTSRYNATRSSINKITKNVETRLQKA